MVTLVPLTIRLLTQEMRNSFGKQIMFKSIERNFRSTTRQIIFSMYSRRGRQLLSFLVGRFGRRVEKLSTWKWKNNTRALLDLCVLIHCPRQVFECRIVKPSSSKTILCIRCAGNSFIHTHTQVWKGKLGLVPLLLIPNSAFAVWTFGETR